MQLSIPDEIIVEQLTAKIVDVVLERIEERLKLLNKATELPPYPNKSEVKSILGIGDDKLNEWISDGLPVILWSKKEIKIDREDIKAHINKLKIFY